MKRIKTINLIFLASSVFVLLFAATKAAAQTLSPTAGTAGAYRRAFG